MYYVAQSNKWKKYLSTFPVRDLDRGRAELLSYGSPGTHTHTHKTKDAPANPWGKVLKVSFKAALSGLPKKEKERGGRRGKQFVTGSLYHHFPSVHSFQLNLSIRAGCFHLAT